MTAQLQNSLQEGLRGFSCPQEGLDPALLEGFVVEYAHGWVQPFVERFATELDRSSDGLGEYLVGWARSMPDFDVAWAPAASALRSAVLGRVRDPLRAAGACAVHLTASGVAGDWHLRLDDRHRYWWRDWVLPPAADYRGTRAQGATRLELVLEGGTRLELGADGEDTALDALGAERATGLEWSGGNLRILGPGDVAALHELPDARKQAELAPSMAAVRCRSALALIERHAPVYAPWVARVVRGILVLEGSAGIMHSASSDGVPGIIALSIPDPSALDVAIAETFVHEASHQYFNVLSCLGPVHDRTVGETCYSPFKQTERPPDAILLAYHAFANVALFHRDCLASGVDDGGYCESNLARHLEDLKPLQSFLAKSRSITPLGQALWQPLAERIALG